MRWILLLCIVAGSVFADRSVSDLQTIDELNVFMQERFLTPPAEILFAAPNQPEVTRQLSRVPITSHPPLGMSRMAGPWSFGAHYLPVFNTTRDFRPENDGEERILTKLESVPEQVGLYLFGRAILDADVQSLNFRALKGPAAITAGTPRPAWYPTGENKSAVPDALPDWKAIYPLAQKAMKSFSDGGTGFETSLGTWRIAARPVLASQERCIACHNSPFAGTKGSRVILHQALGGVLYAFRQTGG